MFHQLEYISCRKHEKKKMSERIVNAIQTQDPPGRFLEFNATSGSWNLVTNKRAIEKTSQTLREGHDNILQLQNRQIPVNNITGQVKDVRSSSQSTTTYLRNNMNHISAIKKPNNQFAVPPSMKYPLNNKQSISSESRSSFLCLASYNKLILANLQKDYSSSAKCQVSFSESKTSDSYQQPIMQEETSIYDTNDMQIDDVDNMIDNDILMIIMDLDPNVKSSIAANASSFTRIGNRRNSEILFPSQSRRRSYCNAAA